MRGPWRQRKPVSFGYTCFCTEDDKQTEQPHVLVTTKWGPELSCAEGWWRAQPWETAAEWKARVQKEDERYERIRRKMNGERDTGDLASIIARIRREHPDWFIGGPSGKDLAACEEWDAQEDESIAV